MKCGKPLRSSTREYCSDCSEKKFSYENGCAVFLYDDIMQGSIADFKFNHNKALGEFFAAAMAERFGERFREQGTEALVPVPVHPSKKRYRGYNQTEVLCRELSKKIRIPVLQDFLIRNKKTVPQKELGSSERIRNLESAISVAPRGPDMTVPKCVALVDDIYTTGSTAEACTRVLRRNGVEKVFLFNLCIGQEM